MSAIEKCITHKNKEKYTTQNNYRKIEKTSIFRKEYRGYHSSNTQYEEDIRDIWSKDISDRDLCISLDTCDDRNDEFWHTRSDSYDRQSDDRLRNLEFLSNRNSAIDKDISSKCKKDQSCYNKPNRKKNIHKKNN